MGDAGDDRIDHLSVADVRTLRAFVVENDENTEPGISDEGAIDYAVTFVADGHFGEQPGTHHEKAFHLV